MKLVKQIEGIVKTISDEVPRKTGVSFYELFNVPKQRFWSRLFGTSHNIKGNTYLVICTGASEKNVTFPAHIDFNDAAAIVNEQIRYTVERGGAALFGTPEQSYELLVLSGTLTNKRFSVGKSLLELTN